MFEEPGDVADQRLVCSDDVFMSVQEVTPNCLRRYTEPTNRGSEPPVSELQSNRRGSTAAPAAHGTVAQNLLQTLGETRRVNLKPPPCSALIPHTHRSSSVHPELQYLLPSPPFPLLCGVCQILMI